MHRHNTKLHGTAKPSKKPRKRTECEIDEALKDTFPSSDPPSWMPGEAKELDKEELRRLDH